MGLFYILTACANSPSSQNSGSQAVSVKIEKHGDQFQLIREGQPYFIKGARTIRTRYMDKVTEYGGNSVRIGYSENVEEVLDEAHQKGITVMFGLPFKPERAGFDYNNEKAVQEQHDRMIEIVNKYKNHPAILLWAIGNELDHIPGKEEYNLKMWNAVNQVAKSIHKVDPNHPAMTVIGSGRKYKLHDLMERCPDLDLLGMNAYGDIGEIPGWLRKYNWNKPYAVTEWGPTGHWQVPKTKWGAVIEETSTEKAKVYRERYENVIASDPWCLGSYVFLWTSNRQERTHTWYNMFHDDGSEKEVIEVMQYMWTGEWPDNRSPQIKSLKIEGQTAKDDINLEALKTFSATIEVEDPNSDELQIIWELIPENKEFGAYAGQGETKPAPVNNAIQNTTNNGNQVVFQVPNAKGDIFRMFVYVYDGHNNVAVANIPFHVRE